MYKLNWNWNENKLEEKWKKVKTVEINITDLGFKAH